MTDALIAEMKAGLEDVTPVPWCVDAAHIARCSPENIAAILARLEKAEAECAILREAIGQLHGPLSVAALVARADKAEAENARLREVLRPFAAHEAVNDADMPDRCSVGVNLGSLRRANAALEGK